jgi:serine/threonine protein kinase
VALKKISKRYTNTSNFKTETDALLRIYDNGGHPNISGLRDMYEDVSHFYLILDLVSGGEMFEHLINYGAYSEADAARLMHEVASALAFIHGVGVVHADLKPENLLLCSKNRLDGTIKMIDFGCAVVEHPDEDAAETTKTEEISTGTTAYWPPERFQKGRPVDAPMDMWGAGVILYIMLTGVHPFDVMGISSDAEIEERICKSPESPPMDPEYTSHLSESAKDLIRRLMEKDPAKRLTAYEMLQHPWVRGETATTEKIMDSDKKLSRFKDLRQQLEAGVFAVLVSHGHKDYTLSESSTRKLKGKYSADRTDASSHIMKQAFEAFDNEGKGYVTPNDLGRVVNEHLSTKLSSSDTEEYIATQRGNKGEGASANNISLSDFSSLFSGIRHKHFPRGHIIFHAGDDGDAMYFINSGKVEIQTRKGQLVAILRSGDFFGEGSLLETGNKRFTSAKCATPVDVIEIKREDFERYVASSATAKNDLKVKWRARNLAYAKNLIRLQTNVKTRVLKKGEVVYREGDQGTSMYRVFDDDGGELEVSHNGVKVHSYFAGESFGESSLLFGRKRSSTVTCISDTCRLHEMNSEDFLKLIEASPEMAKALRDMCRKRLFKKAVKAFSLERKRGLSDEDIVATFHEADLDRTGLINIEELRELMHRMDPTLPMEEIQALFAFIDIDEDGKISLEEFKRLFRQFETTA